MIPFVFASFKNGTRTLAKRTKSTLFQHNDDFIKNMTCNIHRLLWAVASIGSFNTESSFE